MNELRPWTARTDQSIIGHFRTESEAQRWADKWNSVIPTEEAYVKGVGDE